ncbi:16S rRNA (uracil(1498)-N(3))-methyltransferase [Nesterenkonia sp. F]|uniref:16S rRNA (uracil(1498)-N(3))-methyltransferase n=1 Tax=Nesterenkonia sp. F TaxID=795955 RepID=UPI000255D357|nr:16S rRNA (uracil(1498)-N(3))-methyltransferase [Nesterenkonia sp. F]
MTAPLFHLAPGALDAVEAGSRVLVDGAEGHHAATVMRLAPEEEIVLSDTRDRRAEGVVTAVGSGELTVEVRRVDVEPRPAPQLVLVQALAKDRRDVQAIESATELGVERIVPWSAERSVARWKPGREAKKHAEWVSTVRTAAKQTRRTAIPEVEALHTTAQLAERIASSADLAAVVLHETEEHTLAEALTALGLSPAGAAGGMDGTSGSEGTGGTTLQTLLLLVGPEGGISEAEISRLSEAGAGSARLGPSVLRSSTAGPAALTAVQVLLGRWDRPSADGQ